MKKKTISCSIIILVLLFFLYIGLAAPYCHDEWKWSSAERIELMKQGFANYNGRYLGNLLALLITRSLLAKILVTGFTMLGIFAVMYQNIIINQPEKSGNRIFFQAFTALVLLMVPSTLFAQSYGWPAAFVNFAPPVIPFLLCYNWTEVFYKKKPCKFPLYRSLLIIPLGFFMQFFSENITILAVMYAIWLIVYTLLRYRRVYFIEINFLWSTALGAVVMFSNEIYFRAATGQNGYRSIYSSFQTLARQFVSSIWEPLTLNNVALNTILTAVLLLLIIKSGKKNLLTIEIIVVLNGYCGYSIFHRINSSWLFVSNELANDCINTALSVIFYLNVLVCIWLCVDRDRRGSICMLYLLAALAAAPLVAASPIGPRCFYFSYVVQGLAVLRLISCVIETRASEIYYIQVTVITAMLVFLFIYTRMFYTINQANNVRKETIRNAIVNNEKSITLSVLPYHGEYIWFTIPPTEEWLKYFKEFYNIPDDMTVAFE